MMMHKKATFLILNLILVSLGNTNAQSKSQDIVSVPVSLRFVHYSSHFDSLNRLVEVYTLSDSMVIIDKPLYRPRWPWRNNVCRGFGGGVISVIVTNPFPPACSQIEKNYQYIFKAVKPAGNAVFIDGMRALMYEPVQTKLFYFEMGLMHQAIFTY